MLSGRPSRMHYSGMVCWPDCHLSLLLVFQPVLIIVIDSVPASRSLLCYCCMCCVWPGNTHANTIVDMHARTHTHMHAYPRTHTHTHVRTHMHTHILAHAQTHTHAQTHKHEHAQTHKHTHAHTMKQDLRHTQNDALLMRTFFWPTW